MDFGTVTDYYPDLFVLLQRYGGTLAYTIARTFQELLEIRVWLHSTPIKSPTID